jgi:hypothetical protein
MVFGIADDLLLHITTCMDQSCHSQGIGNKHVVTIRDMNLATNPNAVGFSAIGVTSTTNNRSSYYA